MDATTGEKRKRSDSLTGCGHDCRPSKRIKRSHHQETATDSTPEDPRYHPSTASHTLIPYHDQEWAEHRIVSIPAPGDDILWVCGQRIPPLDSVWPADWPMGLPARQNRQRALIARAEQAHRLRGRRREHVRSAAFQALLRREKGDNDRHRRQWLDCLIAPIARGEVADKTKQRQRVALYGAKMGAFDAHERLRADAETFDAPGAQLKFLVARATAAWRASDVGREAKDIRVRFRVGVDDPAPGEGLLRAPVWIRSTVETVSSIWTSVEVGRRLVLDSKVAFARWVERWPAEKRARLMGDGKGRRPNAKLWARTGWEGEFTEITRVPVLEGVLEEMFEGKKGLEGVVEDRERLGKVTDLVDGNLDGMVQVLIRPPSAYKGIWRCVRSADGRGVTATPPFGS